MHTRGALLAGWPLPTLADGTALHGARTKQSSAVGSENTRKQAFWSVATDLRFVAERAKTAGFLLLSGTAKAGGPFGLSSLGNQGRITSVRPWRRRLPASSWRLRRRPCSCLP